MDLANQQRIKDAAEKFGPEAVIVILGSSDAEGAGIYAETVTAGDPTFAGPLAGVALGLPVYHIFEEAVRAEADPTEWENQISMMEMVLDTAALAKSVAEMRGQHGQSVL
jgi:betaine reductase